MAVCSFIILLLKTNPHDIITQKSGGIIGKLDLEKELNKVSKLFGSEVDLVDFPEWSCTKCTLINSSDKSKCSICNAPKPKDLPKGWRCPLCTVINELSSDTCSICPYNKPHSQKKQIAKKSLDWNLFEWICYHCQVVNQPQSSACFVCHEVKTVKFYDPQSYIFYSDYMLTNNGQNTQILISGCSLLERGGREE